MEKPKRLRTAYNIFFQHQRQLLLETLPGRAKKPRNSHGKINFTSLAQTIAARWRSITEEEKAHFEELSQQDRVRYKKEMKAWKELEKAHDLSRMASRINAEHSPLQTFPQHSTPISLPPLRFQSHSTNPESSTEEFEPIPVPEFTQSLTHGPLNSQVSEMVPQFLEPLPVASFESRNVGRNQNRQDMQRLANTLGSDCVAAFVNAFRN